MSNSEATVGILTWYQSLNHGAVLQAYGLHKTLNDLGYKNCFIQYNRKIKKVSLLRKTKNIIRRFKDGTINQRNEWRKFDIEKKKIFDEFIKNEFPVINQSNCKSLDYLVIGSDMVFDLSQGYNEYMFGIGMDAKYIFSYAASSGGYSNHKIINKLGVRNEINKSFENFSGFGYRDQATKEFIESFDIKTKTTYTIDPVLLYGFKDERKLWEKEIVSQPYLLIYSYHGYMENEYEVKQISNFAKKYGLKIISCGYYHPWCDESINASPTDFVALFDKAEFIVTDTFHGTVFSLLFNKRFAVLVRKNSFKVVDLLNRCGNKNKIITKLTRLEDVLTDTDDFEFENWLLDERKNSLNFIKSQLNII